MDPNKQWRIETDQAGSFNRITPAKQKAAALLVPEGLSVSLARNADGVKSADNVRQGFNVMTATGAKPTGRFDLDTYCVSYNGFSPRLRNVAYLEHGSAIYPEDPHSWEKNPMRSLSRWAEGPARH